ncbi:MAG: ABC transporter permease, partial [Ferruginibacter sp.]|nr:ABC transporter permease [Cytophagales bacterium]
TFDRHNANYEAIRRITTNVVSNDFFGTTATTSLNLATTIQQHFPAKFRTIARYIPYGANPKIIHENKIHRIEHLYLADQAVFDIFSYRFIEGNAAGALTGANQAILTERTAERIFGSVPAFGKTIAIDDVRYEITGIIENLPSNSDLPVNGLLSINSKMRGDWTDWKAYTYTLLDSKTESSELTDVLRQVNDKYVLPYLKESNADVQTNFEVQTLKDIHFTNDLHNDTPKGNRTYVYFLSVVGMLLLLIACFNYVNLSVARSLERGVEVGVRKVFGAHKAQLVRQCMVESLMMTGFALVIAVGLLTVLVPLLNGFTNQRIAVFSLLRWEMLAVVLGLLGLVGILSAIYPALYLASFDPGKILKGKLAFSGRGSLKNTLVVIQFAVSIGMMIGTRLVSDQLNYLKDKDIGFGRKNVVILKLPEDVPYRRVTVLKNELEHLGSVEKVSIVGFGSKPGSGDTEKEFFLVEQNNRRVKKTINCIFVDENFLDVLKIRLTEGTAFTEKNISSGSFIVNETFVKRMGWKNPIGKKIGWREEGEVIGVVKDYHYQSLYNKIEPLVLIGYSPISKEMLVRINHPRGIALIQEKWNGIMNGEVFDFSFLDENLDLQYRNDEKMLNLFAWFSLMTSLLAFIGIFALSYLQVQQRTKEIGIRKVLGASTADLLYLFTKKILVSVLIAFLIATPLAACLVNTWSQNFVYRKEISSWVFAFSGCLMLLLALAASGSSVFRAANRNPAKALRNE